MLVATKYKPTYIALFALHGALPYLLIRLVINPGSNLDAIYLTQQLGIFVLLGIAIFLGIAGFYWTRDQAANQWLVNIGPLDLFKICNDTASQVHSEICTLMTSAKGTDNTDESLLIGKQSECFLYSYALVIIAMLNYQQDFLQSSKFKEFNARVLQRVVNIAKEKYSSINVDMELVEAQLKKVKAKDLQNVMLCIEFYIEQPEKDQSARLAMLVRHIADRTSLTNSKNLSGLTIASNNILDKVNTLIQKYNK